VRKYCARVNRPQVDCARVDRARVDRARVDRARVDRARVDRARVDCARIAWLCASGGVGALVVRLSPCVGLAGACAWFRGVPGGVPHDPGCLVWPSGPMPLCIVLVGRGSVASVLRSGGRRSDALVYRSGGQGRCRPTVGRVFQGASLWCSGRCVMTTHHTVLSGCCQWRPMRWLRRGRLPPNAGRGSVPTAAPFSRGGGHARHQVPEGRLCFSWASGWIRWAARWSVDGVALVGGLRDSSAPLSGWTGPVCWGAWLLGLV
jgi:hypothetical protein